MFVSGSSTETCAAATRAWLSAGRVRMLDDTTIAMAMATARAGADQTTRGTRRAGARRRAATNASTRAEGRAAGRAAMACSATDHRRTLFRQLPQDATLAAAAVAPPR